MNDLEKELEKMKNRFEKVKEGVKKEDYFRFTNNLLVANSIFKLINAFNTRLFGTEEENKILTEQIEKHGKRAELALRNIEKGLVEWFDENSKPVSGELGCPYCGEFVYIYFGSHCEAEWCEFVGKEIVYCPKIKCNFNKCQSCTLPLGVSVEEKKYDDSEKWTSKYEIGDLFPIHYKDKTYLFKVVSNDFDAKAAYLIRKFFDYDLTRKEMNEYIILESVNER